jgi:YfiH family protein
VRIYFSGSAGGTSISPYDSLNLAEHVGDDQIAVRANRELVAKALGQIEIAYMNQTHGDTVVFYEEEKLSTSNADALVTKVKGIGLAVLVADCLPIIIEAGEFIAAVHAGRKGVANKIILKTLKAIWQKEEFTNLNVVVGPHICSDCYEVSPEIFEEVVRVDPACAHGLRNLNLLAGVKAQIQSFVESHQIAQYSFYSVDRCTKEDNSYFSFRRNKITGRQVGIVIK